MSPTCIQSHNMGFCQILQARERNKIYSHWKEKHKTAFFGTPGWLS